jgi:hypothetical protein
LLPALVGVFLGSTTLKPGRVNGWGTLVGVAVLAIGISGIQQLGADFYVEPLFNGLTLIGSIGIAGYAQRKRAGSTARKVRSTVMHTVTPVALTGSTNPGAERPPQAPPSMMTIPGSDALRVARDRADRIAGAIATISQAKGLEERHGRSDGRSRDPTSDAGTAFRPRRSLMRAGKARWDRPRKYQIKG